MRVGVISDTHNPSVGVEPPPEVAAAFQGVDLILHAGDIYSHACLDWLETIAPVYAVELGAEAHFEDDPRVVDKKRVLHLEGHTIGMIHDLMVPGMTQEVTEHSPLSKHFPPTGNLSKALNTVFDAAVDIVIFGHTHHAVVEEYQGILMLNPGSPKLPKQMRRLGQVAILELGPDRRSAEILELAQFSSQALS
jgi:putative phosphoesterase